MSEFELPNSPEFYLDPPWKPFKSNGGTGDIPPDRLQPSATVEPTPQPVTSKLCPFRKITNAYYYENKEHPQIMTTMRLANYTEEDFLPCLKEKCMMYITTWSDGYCGFNKK